MVDVCTFSRTDSRKLRPPYLLKNIIVRISPLNCNLRAAYPTVVALTAGLAASTPFAGDWLCDRPVSSSSWHTLLLRLASAFRKSESKSTFFLSVDVPLLVGGSEAGPFDEAVLLSSELLFRSVLPTGFSRTAQSAAAEMPRQSAPFASAGLLAVCPPMGRGGGGGGPPVPLGVAGFAAPPDLRKSGGGGGGGAGGALVGFADDDGCDVS